MNQLLEGAVIWFVAKPYGVWWRFVCHVIGHDRQRCYDTCCDGQVVWCERCARQL